MKSPTNIAQIATDLLHPQGLQVSSCTSIQSLWAGYGHICHVEATWDGVAESKLSHTQICAGDDKPQSLILKYIQPPTTTGRGSGNANKSVEEGHIRKVLSYQVEQFFYTHLAPRMPPQIAVAPCIASINSSSGGTNTTAMVLTDLREKFPIAGEKRGTLNEIQVKAALNWLAGFHGLWWMSTNDFDHSQCVLPPLEHYAQHQSLSLPAQGGVWLNGGYTYLATRRKEYADLQGDSDLEWSSKLCQPVGSGRSSIAELAAELLSSSRAIEPYKTLIHGDVKSENLFTTASGDAVAFYDFQYVGLGLGVCDLAKLFTCSIPLQMLVDDLGVVYTSSELTMQTGEEQLLRAYLSQLRKVSSKEYEWEEFVRHWETALVDWLRFQASWGFWGNSEWLECRVRSILNDKRWMKWLEELMVD
ncbi:hypothetical protein LTR64_003734 [Lithohypha guttulata]|uniref:uncharacterized protein n=1 Tax=Lithohypha guttulata TaxID=1690604 RepID=UPI002DE03380|nr:hypothetical protein LTR51_000046 [Lithohypha guttulata]